MTKIIVIIFMVFNKVIAQEIPQEFFKFKFQELLFDIAENWEYNTTLGSARFQDFDKKLKDHDTLYVNTKFGYYRINNSIALYGFGHFQYQKYLYGYLYPRIINNSEYFIRYSGIPRDISRKGFNSGETDLSGIGFQNSWLSFQIGRGRESWGAGNDIKLALSENSPCYDYAMLGSNYGKIKVKFIYGYLESNSENVNRYITARGIEWSNKSSLIIGLNETVIYSGKDRPIDFAYLNPMSTHLEVELNNRLNQIGTDGSNAVWQISGDCLFYKKKMRLSINYLIDEFVLDDVELDKKKEHGQAFSTRFAYTPYIRNNFILTIFGTYVLVGTPTYRHEDGYNNFIQRNKPLGWIYGSDVYENRIGLNIFNKSNYYIKVNFGKREYGEENILERPYDKYKDYQKDNFPSGETTNILFFVLQSQWWWKKNISFLFETGKNKVNNHNEDLYLKFGIDLSFGKDFTL